MFKSYIRNTGGSWKLVPVLWHDCAWHPRILLRVAVPICGGRFRGRRMSSTSLPKRVLAQKPSRVTALPGFRPFCIFAARQTVSRLSSFSNL